MLNKRQIITNKKITKRNQDTRRPENTPARLAFRQRNQQRKNKRTGPPNTKPTTKKDLPLDTRGKSLCVKTKACRNRNEFSASNMLLIFPYVILDCVFSANKRYLDYIWSANVLQRYLQVTSKLLGLEKLVLVF